MNYGYIRVSTDKQDTENQKLGINEKASQLGISIDEWISDDGISGAKEPEKRLLGVLLEKVQPGDIIIVSELSRLGRKLFMIMRILELLMNKEAKLYSVKDGYNLDNTITSKVLAFAFGLAAEIERDMIQKRTKEGLARRRAQGVIVGRPIGKTSKKLLDGKEEEIKKYLNLGLGASAIARIFGCSRSTVHNYLKQCGLMLNEAPKQTRMKSKFHKQNAAIRSLLCTKKEQIINDINAGVSQTELAQKYSTHEIIISSQAMNKFLRQENLYNFFVQTNAALREVRNADCGKR